MEESPRASLDDWFIWMANEPIGGHLKTLYSLALAAPGCDILELGTQHGVSTVVLASACAKKGGKLYSVDIEPCPYAVDRIREWKLEKSWELTIADDRGVPVKNRSFGLIFVDTSHEKDHTDMEIKLYSPMVLPDGYMVFHDTYMEGKYHPGVSDPIAEFLDTHEDWRTVYTTMDSHGLTVIEKNGTREPAQIL